MITANPHDFVFIGADEKPYRVRERGDGVVWVHYWHPDKHWVTLRKASASDVVAGYFLALPAKDAELYAGGVPFLKEKP